MQNKDTSKDKSKVLKLLPKQKIFLSSIKKEVFYCGGFGSGKTRSLCIKAVMEAKKPNSLVLIIRKTLTSLKKSTLRALISCEEGTDDDVILPTGSYIYNKQENTIQIRGGGVIVLMGLETPSRVLSINASCICIDEATELNENEYLTLFSRLRSNAGSRQMCIVSNPSNPSHFLYKRFFLENSPNREVINAPTIENFLLPKDYIDSLVESYKHSESLYRKYLLGEWISSENAVYKNFSREINVKDVKYDSNEYIAGVDFGFTNQTAILVCQVAGSKLIVKEEVYKRRMLQNEIIEHLTDINNRYPSIKVICDPSAAQLIATINNEGINCVKANNDITLGISRVNQKITKRTDTEQPDLYINPSCVNLITELENYQYDEDGSEKPLKVNDHLVDSLRYIVNHLYDQDSSYIPHYVIDDEEL